MYFIYIYMLVYIYYIFVNEMIFTSNMAICLNICFFIFMLYYIFLVWNEYFVLYFSSWTSYVQVSVIAFVNFLCHALYLIYFPSARN